MANRTVKDAVSIRGTNPQHLVEKIIRSRVYDSQYWKEECFALTAELLVDKAMALRYIGGVFGANIQVTPFICLILKMLQIQPEKDIIVEFIKNEEFKYVRALGAYYMRLVGTSLDCYKYLEPLLADYRKLRVKNRDGAYVVMHMDEYIDQLLTEERIFDVILPRLQKRHILEENNEIGPKVSALDEGGEDGPLSDIEEDSSAVASKLARKRPRSRSAERREERRRRRHREEQEPDHRRERDRRDYRDHKESRRDDRERPMGRDNGDNRDRGRDRDHAYRERRR